jgi:predicted adenylyl cyclase CyaB
MPLEFEYEFYDFDKKKIINKLKNLGAKKKGAFIFKVIVFTHPLNVENSYIRIRDEAHCTTFTYKMKDLKSNFENEDEVIIDNFDAGVKILLNLGCKKKYYYEKIREIWTLKNSEIVFDTNPGEPDRMEVESQTKKELDNLTKELNLVINKEEHDPLIDLFGLVIPKNVDLRFETVKKDLSSLVKKNKTLFNKLVTDQLKLYNKICAKNLKKI